MTLHGVLMEIQGEGVLLSGDSGVGKSELALELLSRGHRLVADDAPQFTQHADGGIEGICPPPLQDFIEVRGLGVVNVRVLFGDGAIAASTRLTLILRLQWMQAEDLGKIDRLRPQRDMIDVLGKMIPSIVLPVAPGRALATLTEAAVSIHILNMGGYDATAEFTQQQRTYMNEL